MKFRNPKNKLERPYVVYADIEATVIPYKHNRNPEAKGEKVALHKPNSAYIYLVCSYDNTKIRNGYS